MPGATPGLAMPYPLATEPVSQGDDAIKALADRIEAVLPRGRLGYAQVVANQTVGTGLTDLAGLTSTVTVGTGRRIRVTADLYFRHLTVSNPGATATINEGATQLQQRSTVLPVSAFPCALRVEVILTPTAGVHTYKAMGAITAAGGELIAVSTYPSHLLVEDIGPV